MPRGPTLANLGPFVQRLVIHSVGVLDSLGCIDALQVITKWHSEHPRVFDWDFVQSVHAQMQDRLAMGLHWLHANDPATFRQLEKYHDMPVTEETVVATKTALARASTPRRHEKTASHKGGRASSLGFGSNTPRHTMLDRSTAQVKTSKSVSSPSSSRRASKSRFQNSGPVMSPRQRRRSQFAEIWNARRKSLSNKESVSETTVTNNQIASLETTIKRLVQSQTSERKRNKEAMAKIRFENARLVRKNEIVPQGYCPIDATSPKERKNAKLGGGK